MLKYVAYILIDENIGRVRAIYHNPWPMLDVEDPIGIYVERIPSAQSQEGFYPVLMVNLETKELYYNYEALPEPLATRDEIAEQVGELKQAIAELTMLIAMP